MIEGRDYCIRFVKLPMSVHGVTVMDVDGFFNIYINADQSSDCQQRTIAHELKHIARNDFDGVEKSLEEIETM